MRNTSTLPFLYRNRIWSPFQVVKRAYRQSEGLRVNILGSQKSQVVKRAKTSHPRCSEEPKLATSATIGSQKLKGQPSQVFRKQCQLSQVSRKAKVSHFGYFQVFKNYSHYKFQRASREPGQARREKAVSSPVFRIAIRYIEKSALRKMYHYFIDFGPGAMENWGLITYKEDSILFQEGECKLTVLYMQ